MIKNYIIRISDIKKNAYRLFISYVIIFISIFCLCACSGPQHKNISSALNDSAFIKDFNALSAYAIAPASGNTQDFIEKITRIRAAISFYLPENSILIDFLPYHSNSDSERAKLFLEALNDTNTQVIWALHGGYGSARIYNLLTTDHIPRNQKLIIGYSDITFLHLMVAKWGWKSIWGSNLLDLHNPAKAPQNFYLLMDILHKRVTEITYSGLYPLNNLAKKSGIIEGRLTGGTLTLTTNSLGTPWQIDADNKILFLEDRGEKGYAVDRYLTHLKQAGIFKKVNAVILGCFTDADKNIEYTLQRFADEICIPVFKADFFGHGQKNYPLIYGAESSIAPSGEIYSLKISLDDLI